MVNKFLNWLVVSSEDPSKVSMTLQGILTGAAGMVISNLGRIGITLSAASYASDVAITCYTVGVVLGVFGLVRKIVNSVKGTSVPVGDKQPLLG